MRLRIEDSGYTLSIEYRCEKHEVRDIKSFFLILRFWLLECCQVRLMPLMYLPVAYIGFNRTRRSNVARNCQRYNSIFFICCVNL